MAVTVTTILKLDFDHVRFPGTFGARLVHLSRSVGARVTRWGLWRSRRGWHVVVELDTGRDAWTAAEITAAQAILGSDPQREAFNLGRARAYDRTPDKSRRGIEWNLLYRQKILCRGKSTDQAV